MDGRGFSSPAGGVRRYLEGLVPALQRLPDAPEVVALGGTAESLPPGVSHVAEPGHPPTNAGWTLVGLPRAASRAAVDLIHAPAYTAPFWAGAPVVVTIHDVSYERHPEWYPYRRDWLRRAFYRRSAHAAARVVTDSVFSASEISAAYGIPGDRISVVPLGVSPAFSPAPADAALDLPDGVDRPFLLHVGDLHERRNLTIALQALMAARRKGAPAALTLVLAGVDRGVGDALSQKALAAGMPDAVVLLGDVDDRRLRALYQGAEALVYPSRYEGFGLPVLEALACGTPVIASRAASIPEVLGDAGLLLDPVDVDAWTTAIVQMATDQSLRARLKACGPARAAQFTWERTARLTLDAYRRVA